MKRSPKQYDLSIVIPALNEEKRIGKTLEALAKYLQQPFWQNKKVEVIVVSADSTDKTHEIVESKSKLFQYFQFLKPGAKVGKGRDVKHGMLHARGDLILFMDADLATPLHHIEKIYRQAERGSDLVVGTRDLRTIHDSLLRNFISNGGNILFRLAGGVWLEDSQCGFKMFRSPAARLCFEKMSIEQWGFDMEILAIAKANKLTIDTHRISDWQDMPGGTFEGKVIKNSLNSLYDLWLILVRRLNGRFRNQ